MIKAIKFECQFCQVGEVLPMRRLGTITYERPAPICYHCDREMLAVDIDEDHN